MCNFFYIFCVLQLLHLFFRYLSYKRVRCSTSVRCTTLTKGKGEKMKSNHYKKRIAALIVEGVLFVGITPYCLVAASSFLDNWLQIPRFAHGATAVIGILFIVVGIFFALWSIKALYTQGKGTPAPVMATHVLVVKRLLAMPQSHELGNNSLLYGCIFKDWFTLCSWVHCTLFGAALCVHQNS